MAGRRRWRDGVDARVGAPRVRGSGGQTHGHWTLPSYANGPPEHSSPPGLVPELTEQTTPTFGGSANRLSNTVTPGAAFRVVSGLIVNHQDPIDRARKRQNKQQRNHLWRPERGGGGLARPRPIFGAGLSPGPRHGSLHVGNLGNNSKPSPIDVAFEWSLSSILVTGTTTLQNSVSGGSFPIIRVRWDIRSCES